MYSRAKRAGPRGLLILLALLTLSLVLGAGLPASAQGTITGFAPANGPVGTIVIISGTEFTGATDVRFGGVSVGGANFSVDSDDQITATVPPDAVSGTVEIDTPGGTAQSADPFTVDDTPQPPTITGFSPARGPEGAPIVLTGSGLSTTTDVEFGNVAAEFSVTSDDHLTAFVPVGAPTAAITVTNPDGSASTADPFVIQPNIVIVLTDDQRYDEIADMPNVQDGLVDEGVTFQNGFVSNPVCCPSRVSILTGQYSSHTGVWSNTGDYGGFSAFQGDGSTVATWLNSTGYETGLVGKYLNQYGPGSSYIPPGWDRWVAFNEANGKYFNYDLLVDDTTIGFGDRPTDYSTDVFSRYADRFIRDAPEERPLFLYFSPYAPHGPSTPPPRYEGVFVDEAIEHGPSFNESDVSDKPDYIASLPKMSSKKIATVDARRREGLEALLGVDDAVGTILTALADTGRLQNTLIFYLSDNGAERGEHRWNYKIVPYEESIRVPYLVRWDRLGDVPRTNTRLAVNIDIAPTIAEAASVPAPGVDGRSLLPLLEGSPTAWRSSFLIQSPGKAGPKSPVTAYCGIRTPSRTFVHYATGEEEYYTLNTDPDQLKNKVSLDSAQTTVNQLRNLARTLCDPLPPDFPPF